MCMRCEVVVAGGVLFVDLVGSGGVAMSGVALHTITTPGRRW